MAKERSVMTGETHVVGDELIEVGFARDFKQDVLSSGVLAFNNSVLKDKIMTAPDDRVLLVKSTINSPKLINSVDYYDEELIANSL